MKIKDLLNKIVNGEEVPKKIKYDDIEYKITKVMLEDNKYWKNYMNEDMECLYPINTNYLNDEVEIIEEEKKIPEKLKDILRIDDLIPPVDENMDKIWQQTIKNQNKINSIIDYLKSKGE